MRPNDSQPEFETTSSADPPSLFQLYAVFFNIGALSFGGGLTGWIFREVVTARRWLSEEEFLSGMALGQILPGTNVTNLSVFIGQRLRGAAGSIACLVGLITAPFFAVLAFYALYDQILQRPWIHAALDGAAAAAIGLLGSVSAKAAQRASSHIWSLAAMVATFVAVGVMRYSIVESVMVIAPLSVGAAWVQLRGAPHA